MGNLHRDKNLKVAYQSSIFCSKVLEATPYITKVDWLKKTVVKFIQQNASVLLLFFVFVCVFIFKFCFEGQ